MEKEKDNMRTFDMEALKTNLPQNRRGLSRYYSGKARSFSSMAEVRCLEDLQKQQHPKKRKKQHSDHHHSRKQVPPLSCRPVSTSNHCASPIVGV